MISEVNGMIIEMLKKNHMSYLFNAVSFNKREWQFQVSKN